ncbi:RNA polymerase subunit sigma-24, partial [Diaphorobacter sp. DS2]
MHPSEDLPQAAVVTAIPIADRAADAALVARALAGEAGAFAAIMRRHN